MNHVRLLPVRNSTSSICLIYSRLAAAHPEIKLQRAIAEARQGIEFGILLRESIIRVETAW